MYVSGKLGQGGGTYLKIEKGDDPSFDLKCICLNTCFYDMHVQ